MTCYYDYVLGLIPAVMIGVTAALSVAGVSLTTSLPIGAAGAIAVIAHALFVNVPGRTETPAGTTSANRQPSNRQPSNRQPFNAD